MTNPGELTHGMPSRDPIKECMREIADLKAQVRSLQAQTNTITQYVSLTDNTAALTSSWTVYGSAGPFVVPANCQTLTLFLWAAAGVTWGASAGGVIGVQVATGTSPTSMGGNGPPISIAGAAGAATSVTTVYSASGNSGLAPGSNYYIGVNAYANGTYAGSGNVHCNGVLIWTRS